MEASPPPTSMLAKNSYYSPNRERSRRKALPVRHDTLEEVHRQRWKFPEPLPALDQEDDKALRSIGSERDEGLPK